MAGKSELQNVYRTVIRNTLGVEAFLDDEGDVTFDVPLQGTFYVMLDAQNDPEYFMLVFPNFYKVDKGNYDTVLSAVNTVNNTNKAVKLSFRDKDWSGNLKASAEMFIAAPNEIPDAVLLGHVLRRTLGAIISGVKAFSQAMSASHPDDVTMPPTKW